MLPPFTRSDLLLTSGEWSSQVHGSWLVIGRYACLLASRDGLPLSTPSCTTAPLQVVGCVSSWIDADSSCPSLRRDSEAALAQELAWAAHLSLQAVVLPAPPQPLRAANYARILNQVIGGLSTMALWVRIPAAAACDIGWAECTGDNARQLAAAAADGEQQQQRPRRQQEQLERLQRLSDPWEWWSQLRFLCEHSTRLGVLLELGPDLPSSESLARWRGEPLKCGFGQAGVACNTTHCAQCALQLRPLLCSLQLPRAHLAAAPHPTPPPRMSGRCWCPPPPS